MPAASGGAKWSKLRGIALLLWAGAWKALCRTELLLRWLPLRLASTRLSWPRFMEA